MVRARPSKGPGPFDEIGKSVRDLLYKDYSYDHKFVLGSTTATGITFEHIGIKKGEGIHSEVKTEYKYDQFEGELKVDTKSKVYGELAYNDPAPGVQIKLGGTIPDQKSAKASISYDHEHAHLTGAIGLSPQPHLEGSITFGQKGLAVGAEGGYDTEKNVATKYILGVGVIKEDFTANLLLADKLDTLKASYMHTLNPTSAVGVEIAHKFSKNDITFTAGASYKIDPVTMTKLRMNNRGIIAGLVQHEFRPKSTVTFATEVDSKALDKSAKFGVVVKLKP